MAGVWFFVLPIQAMAVVALSICSIKMKPAELRMRYMSRYDNTSQDIAGMDFSTCQVIAGIDFSCQDVASIEQISQEIAAMACVESART